MFPLSNIIQKLCSAVATHHNVRWFGSNCLISTGVSLFGVRNFSSRFVGCSWPFSASGTSQMRMPKFFGGGGVYDVAVRLKYLTMYELHLRGPPKPKHQKTKPLDGKPFMKGVVLKTLIKKPKKPNSGNRKCVLVRLSNGKEKIAHVPGEGHTLQEHNIVLVRGGRLKDVPGVKLKVVRGKYDCGHVIKKVQPTK